LRDTLWQTLFLAPEADLGDLLETLWTRLRAAGLPIERSTVALRTLHPEIVGLGYVWQSGQPFQRNQHVHGEFALTRFLQSPFRRIFDGEGPLRARLEGTAPLPFPVLDELRARGMTDYLGLPLTFTTGQVHAVTFATGEPGGFSDDQVAFFHELAPALAVAVEARETRRVARTLLDTYVGSRAGAKVLEGRIRRGDVDMIDAVVLSCDLRGFTALNLELSPPDVVLLLNEYFERVCAPIEKAGGEVVKFMGDGLLSTLPIDAWGSARACALALDAARAGLAALAGHRFSPGGRTLRMGVALHLGQIAFGNLGSPTRLDFTVIGQTVNLAARLAGLCSRLDRPLLVSRAFARQLPDEAESLGVHQIRGLPDPEEVFTYPS
jgi:adenylate cyclase